MDEMEDASLRRAHPNAAICRGDDGLDDAEVAVDGHGLELAAAEAHQSIESAEPQRVVGGAAERIDGRVQEARRGRLVEDAEGLAVEAHQPFVRGQPERAVARLGEAANGAVRQAALDRP